MTEHTPETERPELSFDGKGINGPDEYRSRVATFAGDDAAKKYGPMFAKAPEVLAALQDVLGFLDTSDVRHLWTRKGEQAALIRVLNKARRLARG